MQRISIAFYDEIHAKLTERAKQKNISIAQYVRDLVGIGLRVEAMTEQKDTTNSSDEKLNSEMSAYKKLIRRDLDSSYETLYIVRHILINLLEEDPDKHAEILNTAKVKSRSFVDGLVGDEP